jgi:hypothetical protein
MPARTRVFLNTLEAEFSGPKCQAQIAKEQEAAARKRKAELDRATEEAMKA